MKEVTAYAAVAVGVVAASIVAADDALSVVAQLWSGMAHLPFEIAVSFGR